MDMTTLAAAKSYTYQTIMGAGAVKGDKGDPGLDGLSIKAISITQDSKGKIIEAKATLSDDTLLNVDIITVDSSEPGGDSGDDEIKENGFDSVDF